MSLSQKCFCDIKPLSKRSNTVFLNAVSPRASSAPSAISNFNGLIKEINFPPFTCQGYSGPGIICESSKPPPPPAPLREEPLRESGSQILFLAHHGLNQKSVTVWVCLNGFLENR